jgi:hypothetical protein
MKAKQKQREANKKVVEVKKKHPGDFVVSYTFFTPSTSTKTTVMISFCHVTLSKKAHKRFMS